MSTASQVKRVFAELTRYPEEILDPEADLEADLGIDSVKRVEIIGRLREVMALPPDLAIPERGLNSISAVSRFIEESLRGSGVAPARALASAPAPAPAPASAPRPAPQDGLSWAERALPPLPPAAAPVVQERPAPRPSLPAAPTVTPAPPPAGGATADSALRAVVLDTLIEVLEEARARLGGASRGAASPQARPAAAAFGQDFRGRVALVTGSGRGFGAALALTLARQGCSVVINSFRSRERGEALAARIRAEGGDALHCWGSVARTDALERIFGEIGNRYGGLDFFVSNASDGVLAPTEQITEEHWDRAFQSNVVALHKGALLARPLMRARGGGRIVAMSSTGAHRVTQFYTCMGPVKAAVESLVRYLAVELGPDNIQVNALAAGPLYGDVLRQFPDSEQLTRYWESRSVTGRLGTEEVIIGPLLSLLAPGSSAITGAVLQVDHGGALRI